MNELKIHRKVIKIPSSWDELTTDQLLYLVRLVEESGKQRYVLQCKMMFYCAGMRFCGSQEIGEERFYGVEIDGLQVMVDAKTVCDAALTFDWLFEDGVLAPRFTRNPFPTIETERMTLKGPDDGLTNISFGQYNMALLYWQAMMDDVEENIDKFMAILWKDLQFEPIELGDPGWFEDVDMYVKQVCVFWFVGCTRFIREKFQLTFTEVSSGSKDDSIFEQQQRLIDELAGGDVTRKEEVRNAPLYDALYTIELAMERKKKQQQQRSNR